MVQYTEYILKKDQLVGGGPRKKKEPSIFIAYSFQSEESRNFRNSIERKIKQIPSLQNVVVKDGCNISVGTRSWSSEIRNRLKSSRIVVTELSLLSPEVLFECGFAWGLNKPILPVTRSSKNPEYLPKWFRDIQFGESSTESGLIDVVEAISEHMQKHKNVQTQTTTNLMKPSPNEVVVISKPDAFEVIDKVKQFSNRYDLSFDYSNLMENTLTQTEDSITSMISRASLIVCCLSGDDVDNLIHFALGMLCARPKAGIGKSKMDRRAILLTPEHENSNHLISQSARHVTHIVKVAKESELISHLNAFASMRKKWQKRQETNQ